MKFNGRSEVVMGKKLERKWEVMREGSPEVEKACETRTETRTKKKK